MGKWRRRAMRIALAMGVVACHAQRAPIPFRDLAPGTAILPASRLALGASDGGGERNGSADKAEVLPPAAAPESGGAGLSTRVMPVQPVATRSFFLWNGLELAMAGLDVAATQHCLAIHTCAEGNPLMPHSRGGQIAVTVSLFAVSAGGSYYMKKQHWRFWYDAPLTGAGAHLAGFLSGLRFR